MASTSDHAFRVAETARILRMARQRCTGDNCACKQSGNDEPKAAS